MFEAMLFANTLTSCFCFTCLYLMVISTQSIELLTRLQNWFQPLVDVLATIQGNEGETKDTLLAVDAARWHQILNSTTATQTGFVCDPVQSVAKSRKVVMNYI